MSFINATVNGPIVVLDVSICDKQCPLSILQWTGQLLCRMFPYVIHNLLDQYYSGRANCCAGCFHMLFTMSLINTTVDVPIIVMDVSICYSQCP